MCNREAWLFAVVACVNRVELNSSMNIDAAREEIDRYLVGTEKERCVVLYRFFYHSIFLMVTFCPVRNSFRSISSPLG